MAKSKHSEEAPPALSGRTLTFLAAAAIGILFAAYSNHFRNSFHFDDSHVIQNNVYIRALKNIPLFFRSGETFSSMPTNATYRPLVSLVFALDYRFGHGLNPLAFHVTAWALHLLLGVALFFFLLRVLALSGIDRLASLLALFGTAFFCLHTANTETVNYLSSLSEILSTLGILGSFLLYSYCPRLRRTCVWILPMAVGILAKPPAAMFVPLFAIYLGLFPSERVTANGSNGSKRRAGIPALLAPALLIAGALYILQDKLAGPRLTYSTTSRLQYFQTQLFAWLHYFRLFFLPLGLTADSDWNPIASWYDTRVFAGALFSMALLAIGLLYWRKRPAGRAFLFGVLWYFVALGPASSIVPLSEMINEHRVYFPFIGLVIAFVAAAGDWLSENESPRREKFAVMAALLLITLHAAGTHARNRVWESEETLWKSVTEASPGNARGWMNYGLIFMARGDYDNARVCFEKARALAPNYDILEVNLGILDGAQNRPADAERHFKRAIELNMNPTVAHFYYARWLHGFRRDAEAAIHLEQGIAANPADMDARHLLLEVYGSLGDTASRCRAARETLSIVPDDVPAKTAVASCGSH